MKLSAILAVAFTTLAFAAPSSDTRKRGDKITVGDVNAMILYERVRSAGEKALLTVINMCPILSDCLDGNGLYELCNRPSAKNCTSLVASKKKGQELADAVKSEYRRTKWIKY